MKEELIAAKNVHLKDAINMRKVIKDIVKSVKEAVAPGDPPLVEEPVYVPTCFSDPYDRINRPFIVDHQEGIVGHEEDIVSEDEETPVIEEEEEPVPVDDTDEEPPAVSRKLRVTVQDFGSGIPMPRYGADRPNHDYYASNITLNNMNFVDCSSGQCNISYYDERNAGKDGNSVSSLRWDDTKQFIIENKDDPPTAECKILDNCVGQNKSNTTHKFSMLTSILLYPDGVTDVYFRVGHSHNSSDMKTAHANKAMAKKNLYTPIMVVGEINKMKGLTGRLFDDRDGVFLDWKVFLDKHFPNMIPGFTSYFLFEFKDGKVKYKEIGDDGEIETVKLQTFCDNPATTKKIILRELFNLSPTSNSVEIVRAKPRLPPLPMKRLSRKKIDNMKVIYQQIPRCYRWFYPEGNEVVNEPFTELRLRAARSSRDPVENNIDTPETNIETEEDDKVSSNARESQSEVRRSSDDRGEDSNIGQESQPSRWRDAGRRAVRDSQPRRDVGRLLAVDGVEGTSSARESQPRRGAGRPPRALPIITNQPAIYRFFGSRSEMPTRTSSSTAPISCSSSDDEVYTVRMTRNRVIDSSDEESIELPDIGKYTGGETREEELDRVARNQFEEENRREGEARPNRKKVRVEESDDTDNEDMDPCTSYSAVDVNHNDGRLLMRLKKT